jgi:hypothetical protein
LRKAAARSLCWLAASGVDELLDPRQHLDDARVRVRKLAVEQLAVVVGA